MDRIVVRKRRVHVAETSTNAEVCADNINVACEYCGKIVQVNNQFNVNRAMSGHLRHCKSSTKRIRFNINENTIKSSQDMDNYNEDQNDGLDEVHHEIVIVPLEIKQVDIAANPSISFQLEMIKMYFDKEIIPFTVRNRSGTVQNVCWQTYVLINGFISDSQLSESKGDQLLVMMKELFKFNNVNGVGLPSNYRTIVKACNQHVDSLFQIITWNKSLPADFFGLLSTRNDPLKQVQGAFYPIIQRINEILLVSNPSYFASKFIMLKRNSIRVFGDFQSGECFKMLDAKIKSLHGHNAVPLCFAISLDETTMNTTRSRSEVPVTIMIYNLSGDVERTSFKCELLGYAPKDLHENINELVEVLKRNGITSAKQRNFFYNAHVFKC